VLAMCRAEVAEGGKQRRLALQATRYQPQRRGARPEWEVLVWDIDGPGVRFIKRQSRAAMLDLYRSIGVNPGANVGANLGGKVDR
jgi:hypothetical protein